MSENDSSFLADSLGSDEDSNDNETTANPSANPASDGTDDYAESQAKDTETKTVEVQAEVPVDNEVEKPATTEVDTNFVVAQTLDPRRSIPGTSQYLDEVERRRAEQIRAKAEDREPDLENPPAFQGTPLYTEAQAKQQGLDVSGEAVQSVTLPVTVLESEQNEGATVNYDAYNGSGGTVAVNTGAPV